MNREALLDMAREYQQQGFFPSLAVSIFDTKGSLVRFTLGDAREDSLFDLASLTKLATATMVLQAVEQGRLSLTDKLGTLLPLVAEDDRLRAGLGQITVFDLLTHTAGLPAWYPFYTKPDLKTALLAILDLPKPAGVEYSDIGFVLLGKLLEHTYGQPLDVCLQEQLATPLDLPGFAYLPDQSLHILPSGYGNPKEEEMLTAMHLGFDRFRSKGPIIGQVHDGNAWYAFGGVSGHAGIFSGLSGVEALGRHYLVTDKPLLTQAMQEQVPGRGLGFETGEMYPQGCGHTGFTGTSLYLSRELGVGCVILSNRCYYPDGQYKLTNPYRRRMHQLVAQHFAASENHGGGKAR